MNRLVNLRAWLHRPLSWLVLVLAAGVAVALYQSQTAQSKAAAVAKQQAVTAAALARQRADEARDREQELQNVICGVYVPIGNAKLPPYSSPLARTIVVATKHGASRIHCPGIK